MHDILSSLVAFPTVTGDHTVNREALRYIASYLEQRGLQSEIVTFDGYDSLYASTRGTKRPKVLLAAHLDVVPAPNHMFQLHQADGRYSGRGTLDMKFAIASYLQAIDDLQHELSSYDLGILITTDEEIGGQYGVGPLVDDGYLPQVCVLPDGGDDWQIQTYSKGFMRLDITATGKPAHASRPWLGKNAILAVMHVVPEIYALFPEPMGAETNTINLGMVRGGTTHNQVAESAAIGLDIRFLNKAEQDRLLAAITNICQSRGLAVEVTLEGAVGEFDLAHPLIATFVNAIEDIVHVKVTGSRTLGSNDARFFAVHDIPCISLYPPGGGHHGPDEWVSAEGMAQFHQVLMRYLQEVARV